MTTLTVKENNYVVISAICRDKNGVVQDVTGFDFEFLVVNKQGQVILRKVSSDPTQITIVDAPNGKVEVYIQPEDTRLKSGDYEYEFKSTDLDGHPVTLRGPAKFVVTKTII